MIRIKAEVLLICRKPQHLKTNNGMVLTPEGFLRGKACKKESGGAGHYRHLFYGKGGVKSGNKSSSIEHNSGRYRSG